MKKLISGAALLLGGIVGFVGFLNVCIGKVQPGAYSSVFSAIHSLGEWLIILFFVAMMLFGIGIIFRESRSTLKED